MSSLTSYLENISYDGVPETRLASGLAAFDFVNRLLSDDAKRNVYRAKAKGLFDGNQPMRQSDLVKAGQAYRHNFNSRVGESFLNTALSAYWDMVTEGPSKATVRFYDDQEKDQVEDWSTQATECFQEFNLEDPKLNYMFQVSQYWLVLHGSGPVFWESPLDYRARPVKQVLVPDGTESDVNMWESAAVETTYTVSELYAYIRNESAASDLGWNVKATRQAIIEAVPRGCWPQHSSRSWEWLQQTLRNNDIAVSSQAEVVQVAHVFYKEFNGKITHAIIDLSGRQSDFLFRRVGKYDNWRQVICPMYYDIGDGTHHSVKGMGVKAFGALDAYNRMNCSMMDQAQFAGSMHIQTATENMRQQASVIEMGPYKVWPAGFTVLPNLNLGQMLEGPMMVKQDLLNTVTANLSQYRQDIRRKSGNPVTATQMNYEAENESILGKTQATRYFDQLDEFYQERWRRVTLPSMTQPEVEKFRKKLRAYGIPDRLLSTACVTATRTVGYGSPYSRLTALNRMLSRYMLYGQEGQYRILEDLTTADVGVSLMRRYVPEKPKIDQNAKAFATLQVAGAKEGVPPVVTDEQDHILFAETFLEACAAGFESLQKGANPEEVHKLVEMLGPAIMQHLQKAEDKKQGQGKLKGLQEQYNMLAQVHDQLEKKIAQNAQQQQAQAQAQQQVMSDEQLKQMKAQNDIERKNEKTRVDIQAKQAKTQQGLRAASLKTRQGLMLSDAKTAADLRLKKAKSEQEAE